MSKQLKAQLNHILQNKAAVGLGLAVSAGSTFAAIDTTEILATIALVVTAAGVVGAATLAMHYGIKAYKWLRAAG